MTITKKLFFSAFLLMLSHIAIAQQCFNGNYRPTGSMNIAEFNTHYGVAADMKLRVAPEVSHDPMSTNMIQVCYGRTPCRTAGFSYLGGVRVTWDPNSGTAFFSYLTYNDKISVGWVDQARNVRLASNVLGAESDETPVISYNQVRDVLLIAYEGNSSDRLYYATRSQPIDPTSIWEHDRTAGQGETRFGPDKLCAGLNNNQFILQYRGKRNSSTCYQVKYNILQNNWGAETSCDVLVVTPPSGSGPGSSGGGQNPPVNEPPIFEDPV